ncbi:hypothetical protein BSZ35_08570 [Salinibacter sp. 10B]|uniref:FG-GAP repeat protein n=1 Tax=Salinibacter sp. 10B TaxID=1923971 RepID=UPI000CF56AD9|nr:FG-GAP repeat protein [Salinibacter sp. 10B]PQJ34644.1 hypothetical protein BSZ35_08570 [Salinibacter sp. 10B]
MSVWGLRLVVLLEIGLLIGAFPSLGYAQIDELPRPDTAHAGSFGVSVALGDSIAVVGASGEERCGPNAGAVYIYEREVGPQFDEWNGVARLTPRTCRANAFFGEQVALSGHRLLVSASSGELFAETGSNAAYMFTRTSTGTWTQTARFTGPPNRSDGSFAADIDLDDDRAVVSTSGNPDSGGHGAVYVYNYDAATEKWTQSARLTAPSDETPGVLGRGVSLHGNRVAVAASTYFDDSPGTVYVFRRNPEAQTWAPSAHLTDIDAFFIELELYGSVLLVGEDRAGPEESGQATIFTHRRNQGWRKTETLRPSLPYDSGAFGTAVALERSWALVTGYGEQLNKDFNIDRVVYVFRRRGGQNWRQRSILDIGQVDFGAALDLHNATALVSSVPPEGPGSVYIVQLH